MGRMLKKYATMLGGAVALVPTGLSKWAHRHTFQYEPRKGYIYVRSRAISSRTNDNYDTFPADELKVAWHTFIGKPVFVNHHNDNIHRKRGVIIDAALHEDKAPDGTDDTWVEVLMEVDALRFPLLATALINHDIERTSMGTDVLESKCSYCGNVAKTPDQYCPHISRMKGQRLRRKNEKTGAVEDVLVHEICSGLSFFENSLLVEDPADPTAFAFGLDVRGILGEDEFEERLSKTTSFKPVAAVNEDAEVWEGDLSMDLTDEAVFMLGLDSSSGWSTAITRPTELAPVAERLLRAINGTPWSGATLYSGHVASNERGLKAGGQFVIPFMATTHDERIARNFAFAHEVLYDPTVYVFEPGVHGVPINAIEVLVSGKFSVTKVEHHDDGLAYIHLAYRGPAGQIKVASIEQRLAKVASFKPPRSASSSATEAAAKATEWIERDGHDLGPWRVSYKAEPKEYRTECTQCGRTYEIRPWSERDRKSIQERYPRILDSYLRRVLTPDYILHFSNGRGEDEFFSHTRCDPVLTARTLYRGMQLYDSDTVAKVYQAFKSGNISRVGQMIIDFFMEYGGLGNSWSGTEQISRGYAKGKILDLSGGDLRTYDFDPKEFARQDQFIPVFLTGTMLRSDQRKNYRPSDMMANGPLPEYAHENEVYLSKNEVMTISVEVWIGGKWVKVGDGIKAKASKTADSGGWQVYGPFPPTKRPGPSRYSRNWMVNVRKGDLMRQFLFKTEEDAMAFIEEANTKPFGEVDRSRVLYASKTAADWVMPDNPSRVEHRTTGQVGSVIEDDGLGFLYVLFDGRETPEFVGSRYLTSVEKSTKTAAVALDEAQRARFKGTGVDKDKDGYYCKTHRCRSDSYASIDEIPDSAIEFIQSTGTMKTALPKYCDGEGMQVVPTNIRWVNDIGVNGRLIRQRLGDATCPVCAGTEEVRIMNDPDTVEMPAHFDAGQDFAYQIGSEGSKTAVSYNPNAPRVGVCPYCKSTNIVEGDDWMGDVYSSDAQGYIRVCMDCKRHFLAPLEYQPGAAELAEQGMIRMMKANPHSPMVDTYLKGNPSTSLADELRTLRSTSSLDIGLTTEIRVPPEVQTLRAPQCPVCDSDASWSADGRCSVCGYLPPPKPFREPDTDVAGRTDQGGGWFDPELTRASPFKPDMEPVDGKSPASKMAFNPVQSPHSTRKGQRLTQGVPMASVASAARQRIAADRALADENARLREQVARLRRRADIDNPAQPVPEPAATAAAPVGTADATVDVTNVGGVVAPPNLSAPGSVTTPGQELPSATIPSTNVEAPVSGTTEIDPKADGHVDPDASGETLGENAFAGDWINTSGSRGQRTAAGKIAAQVRDRIWASVRLARLRIQAGTVQGTDDLELGRTIEASKMSIGEIQAESSGLAAALRARPMQQNQQRTARRAPSLAAGAQPTIVGLAPRDREELLFE